MRKKTFRTFERARRAVVSSVKDYIVIVRGRAEGAGLATTRTLLRAGPLGWLGLLALFFNVVATAYLILQRQAYPTLRAVLWEGEEIALPSPALSLSLLFISLGWAYLLCGAAMAGPWAYLVVVTYVAFYGLYAGMNLAGSFWFVFLPLCMLALGTWTVASSTSRWRKLSLFALSLLVAILTYGSLGLNAVVPSGWGTWGKLGLGVIYFVLVANPRVLKKHPLKPGLIWGASFAIFAAFYTASLWHSPYQEVLDNVFLAANGLLGLVGLFWYWIGLDLFNGAQDLAEWLAGTVKSLMPRRSLAIIIFSLWFVWAVVTRFLAFTPSLHLAEFLGSYSWGRAWLHLPLELPLDLLSALEYDFYLTMVIACVAFILWQVKRLSPEGLVWLLGLSITALFFLWGYFGRFFAIASAGEEMAAGSWPIVIYVGGMFWQIFKVSPDLLTGKSTLPPKTRLFLFLGFLLPLGGISHLELLAGYPQFEQELALNPLFGVLYLGLPYLLYTVLYQQKRYTPVPVSHLLLLFALGMLSAIPVLLLKTVFLAPPLWLLAILMTVWHSGRWDERWDGLVYITASAMGFITFYTHPLFIPIPAFTTFLGHLANLQQSYMFRCIYPWDLAWWQITLGALGAAIILGYFLAEARQDDGYRGLFLFFLGIIASLAFLAVCEFAFQF